MRDARPCHIRDWNIRYIGNVHDRPFVTTIVEPGERQIGSVESFGERLPVKCRVYKGNKTLLRWNGAPNQSRTKIAKVWRASASSSYTITDLGTLGGSASGAHAINDEGDIVGWADTPESKDGMHPHAFLWRNGSMIDLGEGEANAINRHGQVVGRLKNQAFLYQNGKIQYLQIRADSTGLKTDVQEDTNDKNTEYKEDISQAVAINDLGQIVVQTSGAHEVFSWIWQAGQVLRLSNATVIDINNKGHIVGQWKGQPGIYTNGSWRDLGTLGGEYGTATRINDEDEVLGAADTKEMVDAGDDRAGSVKPLEASFVWRHGKMTRLPEQYGPTWKGKLPPYSSGKFFFAFPYLPNGKGGLRRFTQFLPASSKWTQLSASAINRKGQIVGVGKINNNWRAFLMSPIHAPNPKIKGQ